MLNKLFSLNSPSTEQRFQLLRNFSIVSLSTFVLATSLLAIFYRRQAVHDLVISTEENNITTTQIFANTLWPRYGTFLSSTQPLSDEKLVAPPQHVSYIAFLSLMRYIQYSLNCAENQR